MMGLIQSPLRPGFVAKQDVATYPVVGEGARGLQCLFITRGTDEKQREIVIEEIMERQKCIEEEVGDYNPFCVFAEGTTTNGTAMLKFKRGAFMALRTVTPVVAKVNNRYMRQTFDIVAFWPLLIQ